jgi:hypothetical protein
MRADRLIWTPALDVQLFALWPDTPMLIMASEMGVSAPQITARVRRLRKLGRAVPERTAIQRRERRGTHYMQSSRRVRPTHHLISSANTTAWDDGWRIKSPSLQQLMAGR